VVVMLKSFCRRHYGRQRREMPGDAVVVPLNQAFAECALVSDFWWW
jgi:hypothetical protein